MKGHDASVSVLLLIIEDVQILSAALGHETPTRGVAVASVAL